MKELLIRCSSLGKIMTEPKSKSDGILSIGAKTYIRELAAQEIFGVDFEVSSKQMEKGILVEEQSIQLLNRVRGLNLSKNKERRTDGFLTGECDLFEAERRRGRDIKSVWSLATLPITELDCQDKGYEWQCRGYMKLWDADEWSVDYVMVDTPDDLIGYENMTQHLVSHIPEHHRLTSWVIKRDAEKEALINERVKAAREYMREVISEFDRTHTLGDVIRFVDPEASATPSAPTPATPKAPAIEATAISF
ncbi:hypothetical protein [Curvibacter lanceolatus]|uniref:hypothetical protein n=1 Tax=Curvibacter lanceolatus TaxID=86182 RepID=UPI00037EF3A0|nr:hypothetical protein [Curvibacter lanceolatus]